jgi:hypothetical protein
MRFCLFDAGFCLLLQPADGCQQSGWHGQLVLLLQGVYDYGAPDYMPFWPSCMSGVCLGAIFIFAKMVLALLQPVSPSRPIIQAGKKGTPPRQTLNNVRGYWLGFWELKHLPAQGSGPPIPAGDMARIVNTAISSAGFLSNCWQDVRAAGV